MTLGLQDPYATDDTPIVSVNVGGRIESGQVVGGTDVREVLGYSYTSDIISLTDTAAIDIANPNGKYSNVITKGSRLIVTMADPKVNGGAKTIRLSGLVVNPRSTSKGGEKIQIQGADQGWYLEKCDAPLWFNLESSNSLESFLNRLLRGANGEDYGWGFYDGEGVLKLIGTNDIFRRLNQGRAGLDRTATIRALKGQQVLGADGFIPPLQVETGTKIGQLLIDYCRRARLLVNVTSLGYLQIFRPNYTQAASYSLEYHADPERNARNGVIDVTVDDSVDGIATDVTCVSQKAWNKVPPTNSNPNVDKNAIRYTNTSAAPHFMRMTFGDNDQLDRTAVANRARWAQQRPMFDAFSYQVEVFGHSQSGVFYAPDTMVAVTDFVHNIVDDLYCSACHYVRDGGGTRTILTLRRADLLAA